MALRVARRRLWDTQSRWFSTQMASPSGVASVDSSGASGSSASPASEANNTFKLALCQTFVVDSKPANIKTAIAAVDKAARHGAQIIALAEYWNTPFDLQAFTRYAEEIPPHASQLDLEKHPSSYALSEMAKKHQVFLIGGSIPEKHGEKLFNTCVVFSPQGEILTRHRKMHLFDVDVPGKITFKESEVQSAGDQVTLFETPYCKIGIGICYDIRFPQLSMIMRQRGAKMLVFPSLFGLVTGSLHWELLQRARAVDNQLFVATVSPSRGPEGTHQAWGHSSVVSPWGEVIATCDHQEAIVYTDIDLTKVDEVRRNIPMAQQLRPDVYQLIDKTKSEGPASS